MRKSIEKLVVFFLLPMMMGVVNSCSDDEESSPTSNLTGSWQSVRVEYFNYYDGQKVISKTVENSSKRISFLEDGTFIYSDVSDSSIETFGTWKYADGVI